MTLETQPNYSPALLGPAEAGRAGLAPLPSLAKNVVAILRERGVARGSVLLLADCTPRLRVREHPLELRVTAGSVAEGPALLTHARFDAIVVMLERGQEFEQTLHRLATCLAPGTLLVASLPAASGSRKRLDRVARASPNSDGALRHDRQSAHLALLRAGFESVWAHSYRATLCVSARRAPDRAKRICSIVVPVFNEKQTFPELMRRLLAKRLDHLGLEREIILVESNSTDGTRELVASFENTPQVRILWQPGPRGKGHAVRAGFAAARGDIVMIQDADLEYDLDDYDVLLEPLLREQAAFVLGSRHSGRVRMRRFTDQRLLGEICNAAHLLFTAVINILYRQRLKDPFTMFKVLRRDCLYGLRFECDRFDFDHELLIKLLLKGYRPLEVPVRYRSRSFKQGKKIRFFRDPPGWLAADFRYRLQRLRPHFD